MANPVALAAAAIAAGLAWLVSRKKEDEKTEPALSVQASTTPDGGIKAAGEVTVPDGALTPSFGPITATSAGMPKLAVEPPGTGTTSGATSTAPDGSPDDAFSELLAKAIANKDIEQLIKLAAQAEARGLLDIARSIRDEIARLTESAPPPTTTQETAPKTATPDAWSGRAVISYKAGSRGLDVIDWQRVVSVTQDGIFGPITDSATRAWQKSHGLVVDGIVGPKTWEAAYKTNPWLATTPRGTVIDALRPKTATTTTVKAPTTTTTTTTTTATRPTLKRGSTGVYVKEWQRILGNVTVDGIFGAQTEAATKAWQQARPPLVVDGIVGPKTWSAALTGIPAPVTSVAPKTTTTTTTTTATRPTLKRGSTGSYVKEWQSILGNVTVDGIFGAQTEAATKAWQQARPPLVVDGIVGPKTWSAALTGIPAPVMSVAPSTAVADAPQSSIVESPQRAAAKALTDYLTSIGGLAGRGKEDKTKVKTWQAALGLTADGLYGRNTARAVILQGYVPVVPYYWPRINTTQAKAEFTTLVKQYASTDPNRKAAWDKLLSDIQRS